MNLNFCINEALKFMLLSFLLQVSLYCVLVICTLCLFVFRTPSKWDDAPWRVITNNNTVSLRPLKMMNLMYTTVFYSLGLFLTFSPQYNDSSRHFFYSVCFGCRVSSGGAKKSIKLTSNRKIKQHNVQQHNCNDFCASGDVLCCKFCQHNRIQSLI